MSSQAREAIVERIEMIADWRREREQQDMLGLGPEAATRSRRSADGLRELADHVRSLADDDPRLARLRQLAFHSGQFDPGASLLNELGRFRFHDPATTVESFTDFMVELAEEDASEQGRFGGPQVAGDDPWRATWTMDMRDADEEEW
ncbi:MAG TPA: hypothetical protein VM450_19690 [Thermomicrobiales bacterium]|nr:hypothetical protein [Thermomicrobiales bacterium]